MSSLGEPFVSSVIVYLINTYKYLIISKKTKNNYQPFPFKRIFFLEQLFFCFPQFFLYGFKIIIMYYNSFDSISSRQYFSSPFNLIIYSNPRNPNVHNKSHDIQSINIWFCKKTIVMKFNNVIGCNYFPFINFYSFFEPSTIPSLNSHHTLPSLMPSLIYIVVVIKENNGFSHILYIIGEQIRKNYDMFSTHNN